MQSGPPYSLNHRFYIPIFKTMLVLNINILNKNRLGNLGLSARRIIATLKIKPSPNWERGQDSNLRHVLQRDNDQPAGPSRQKKTNIGNRFYALYH